MSEQIIMNIVRPEVGVSYVPESHEAEDVDRLAACYLSINALARHIHELHGRLRTPCPDIIEDVIRAELWRNGA